MRFGSVCSGIEAASVAWNPLGWEASFFSEIEPFPCAVLAHHYPHVPNLGDMTKFKDWPDAAIDVLAGGTPCQSFSVAGLRKGLADPRGNLALTYLAIADRYRPRWLVWENVPGVLSSNGGRDFGAFLGGMGELGYGFAYRVLDAQFVRVDGYERAVPQRRRRVFVVGYLGDWRPAAAVLFERESLLGNPAPRRQAGQGLAADAAPSLVSSGRGVERAGETRGQDPVVAVAYGGGNTSGPIEAAACLVAKGQKCDFEVETFVCAPEIARTLTRGAESSGKGGYAGRRQEDDDNLVAIPFDTTQITSALNRSVPKQGDPCHPLAAGAHPPAIAFDCKAGGETAFAIGEVPGALRGEGHGGGHAAIQQGWAVRRLTPRECERLQGFPDDYTAITHRGKPAADGPRYKALGNSWAVNCPRWIGRRIQMVDDMMQLPIAEAAE